VLSPCPSPYLIDAVLRRVPRASLIATARGLALTFDERNLSSLTAALRSARVTDAELLAKLADRDLRALGAAIGVGSSSRDVMIDAILAKGAGGESPRAAEPRREVPETVQRKPNEVATLDAASFILKVKEPEIVWPAPVAPKPKRTRKKAGDALEQAGAALKLTPAERLPGNDDETFVAIDFETADSGRDSACAVALVRVEQGQIVRKVAKLIRPPRSSFPNAWVHGIQWEHVRNEPTFGELWPALREVFTGAVYIVAHNAPFDRSVLRACCAVANVAEPTIPFECSMKLTRRTWKLESAKLNVICAHLGIPLKHHDAASDAEACARVVLAARREAKQAQQALR
jgi:DNA polymerase-3 subunit epsilon